MSMARRKGTAWSAPHVGERHDLIRVHGAGVNNRNDVSVEIPKRRLTVFTGVSGTEARADTVRRALSCVSIRRPR